MNKFELLKLPEINLFLRSSVCLFLWNWIEGYVPDCLLQRLVLILISELTG